METVDLEMEDLFGDGGEEREELQMPAELPEMDSNEGPINDDEDEERNEDEENVLASIKNLAKGAAKRRVLRPQPKLDAERLRSSRGLPALPKLFKEVKFKGKGHEASDLKLLMGRLEHWAHRLYPQIQFDDFIRRLEKLGAKREVQTCIKRIRMDMPVLDEDFVDQEGDRKSEGEADQVDPEAAFEEMLEKEKELTRREQVCDEEDEFDYFDGAPSTPVNHKSPGSSSTVGVANASQATPSSSQATPTPSQSTPSSTSTANGNSSQAPPTSTPMSEDMKKRMEANRLTAMKKRALRLGIPVEALIGSPAKNSPATASTQDTEPPSDNMETEDS